MVYTVKAGDIVKKGQLLATGQDTERDNRIQFLEDRIRALDELHRAGVRTYAMIAPILSGAEGLPELLKGKVDYLLIDRMNYNHAAWVYRKYKLEDDLTDDFFLRTGRELASTCRELGIDCSVVY